MNYVDHVYSGFEADTTNVKVIGTYNSAQNLWVLIGGIFSPYMYWCCSVYISCKTPKKINSQKNECFPIIQ